MGKNLEPHDVIRTRLEELFHLGATLQDYIRGLHDNAPFDRRTKEVTEELLRLETKLLVINEILYQEKNSLTIERAMERLKHGYSKI